jgi:SPP1 gp7 family putative phage head morphogenesis protein
MALGIGGTSRPIPDGLSPSEFARLFRLTPHKAIAALQRRPTAVTTLSWAELWQSEHSRQFTISRLTRLDLVKDFHKAILDSVQGDLSRRDYMRDMEAMLKKEGWWGKKEVIDKATGEVLTTRFDSRRLRLIYDVNTRQANANGRWERIQQAKHSHPYLRYVTKNDEKVRHAHKEWHNLTLPVDDPFWNTHYPPNGWNCRCTVRALSQRDYDKGKDPFGEPLKTTAPEVKYREWKHKQTGRIEQVPIGIDPGWGYNVGNPAQSGGNLSTLVEQKLKQMPQELAQAVRKTSITQLGDGHHVLDSWRGMGQRPGLLDLPPMPIIDVPEDAFGGAQGKVALAKAADAALKEIQESPGLMNDDSGWLLSVNSLGRKKMGNNADQNPEDSRAVSVLKQLVLSAVIGERHADTRHENVNVKAIYRLFAAMRIKDELYRVQLTVKDYSLPDKPHKLHALESLKIESAPLGILPSTTPKGAEQKAQPTTGRTISIAQLMAGRI